MSDTSWEPGMYECLNVLNNVIMKNQDSQDYQYDH